MSLKTLDFQGFPESIETDVERVVRGILHLLPSWISHFHVIWDGSDHENDATISTEYEYRRAVLTICPAFLTTDDRRHVLIHEIGHIVTDPFTGLTERIVETLVPEGSRAFATGEIARHKEMLAEDLALLIAKMEDSF